MAFVKVLICNVNSSAKYNNFKSTVSRGAVVKNKKSLLPSSDGEFLPNLIGFPMKLNLCLLLVYSLKRNVDAFVTR